MEVDVTRKVFILGDSRTGTTTLHKFLKLAGYASIHYFFKESGVSEPAHADFDANWVKLKSFIESGEYEAFSDYPLRTFYRQLFESFPDAFYILTVRKDVNTWRRSMEGFFSKFNITLNIDSLTNIYNTINDNIREIAISQGAKFCEICIDDDPEENGVTLSNFLGLDSTMSLGWENSTTAYDNSLWSTRVTLFNTTSSDFLTYVKRITNPSKAMLSEYGWVFLINDSSDFLDYCYGGMVWSDLKRDRAVSTLNDRQAELAKQDILYLKFIVPEKSIIYSQYLPKIFEKHEISDDRPAVRLAKDCASFVSYPVDALKDARSYGNIYFRGDSHANWLGAFFIYQHIVEKLNSALGDKKVKRTAPFTLADFDASLVSYAGDLFTQLDKEMMGFFEGAWKPLNLSSKDSPKVEYLVQYLLATKERKAVRATVEDDYLALLGERATFRYSHPNKELPRAVIFRDSTADYLVDVLAEHFSESIFIWHKGNVYSDVIEREKPDVVLHLMAERFVVQYENFPALKRLGI
jgi:hypothetical protein